MEAPQFYPERPTALPATDLAARVAELERVVATLAALGQARQHAPSAVVRHDPVALTAALHPRSLRSARSARHRSPSDGTIALRFVLFEPLARD